MFRPDPSLPMLRAMALLGLLSAAAAQQRPSIVFQNDRLTARVENVPIRAFLEEITQQTKVAIFASEQIGDDIISVEMSGLRLDEALRAALPAYDTFFYYQAGDGAAVSLRAVWIYPKGAGTAMRPVPPQLWAGSRELEASLGDRDPRVRARGYNTLLERDSEHSRDLLLSALRGREADESVRQSILSGAIGRGTELPPDVLADLARDSSEGIRWMALDALWQQGASKEVAEMLSTDPSEAVRQKAAEILDELKAAAGRREAGARSPDAQP